MIQSKAEVERAGTRSRKTSTRRRGRDKDERAASDLLGSFDRPARLVCVAACLRDGPVPAAGRG